MSAKQINKKNILNIAWIGQGDFGDEVMAYVLRRFLKQKLALEKIAYYQHGHFAAYRGRDDLAVEFLHDFNGRWKRKIFDNFSLKKFNTIIIGGGSILHSSESIRWKLEIIRKLKKLNKSIFSACVGVSLPAPGKFETVAIQELLGELDIFITRDSSSAQTAIKLTDKNNIYESMDTSLLLPELCPADPQSAKDTADDDLVGVIVVKSLAREHIFNRDNHRDQYLKIINYLLDKNKKVILFTLYIGDSFDDVALNQTLKRQAKNPKKVSVYDYDGDIFSLLKEMKRCNSLVSMRLHGIIAAYFLGIPFLSLAYDKKNLDFCLDINYPKELSLDFDAIANLEPVYHGVDFLLKGGENHFLNSLTPGQASMRVKNNLDILANRLNTFYD